MNVGCENTMIAPPLLMLWTHSLLCPLRLCEKTKFKLLSQRHEGHESIHKRNFSRAIENLGNKNNQINSTL